MDDINNNENEAITGPERRHEKIGVLVERFIERSHYNHTRVNDELSSLIFSNYIDNLDENRSYFTKKEIKEFEVYRFEVDDMLGAESLGPVFKIFDSYRTIAIDRMEYALELLNQKPDFTLMENFQFDRSKGPWPNSIKELNELWRKRVKNDALNLMLNEKDWAESKGMLQKRYARFLKQLKQINNDDIFETFMNSVVHTLDPHSSYFSPRNSEEYQIQMSLSYFGIGASLSIEDDYVSIVNIIPGGPAAIDGQLKPKDRITAIAQGNEGELTDVIGWRLDDVVQLIRGPENTIVRLQILPDGSAPGEPEKIINLTRDQIKLEESAAKSEVINTERDGQKYSIGVIDIPSFYRDYRALKNGDEEFTSTTTDVKRLLNELKEEDIDGLIIDLRNNGGGHLTEATALSGLFIDNGPIVQLRNANGRISRLDDPDPVPRSSYNGPLIVLVNRYSASASEIFAAAIQDYNRGIVVGQQTYGKGTVQNLYVLDQYVRRKNEEELGQLTLTIGKYYRVTGESTQNKGVFPDIALPSYIDPNESGESARKASLPWDTIRSSKFKQKESLEDFIPILINQHKERKDTDPDMIFLVEDIKESEKNRSRTMLSLNLEKRIGEREAILERKKQREEIRDSSLSNDKNEDRDINLNEAAAIATDLALLVNIGLTDKQVAKRFR
ncbi:MAG: carboxy terminal-processing peptidase [Pseudomonadota bacterium]|nr:carboxy terminal-processing peptidase [Pseudomonadota bacterium]